MSKSSILNRLAVLEKRSTPVREPRQYVMALVEGEALSEKLRAKIQPGDSLCIRLIPRGYLGDIPRGEQSMGYWQKRRRGQMKAKVIRESDD